MAVHSIACHGSRRQRARPRVLVPRRPDPSYETRSTNARYANSRQTYGPDIVETDAHDICVIQLVPYHSKEGAVATKVANGLPSSRKVQRFVQDALVRRVPSGDAALIVARSAKLWGVTTEEPGVVIYRGAEPRRAFQTSGSRGGKLLRKMVR